MDALEVGLVDSILGREDVIELCEEETGYSSLEVIDFEEKMWQGPSFLDLVS